jgi:hypothetical protein
MTTFYRRGLIVGLLVAVLAACQPPPAPTSLPAPHITSVVVTQVITVVGIQVTRLPSNRTPLPRPTTMPPTAIPTLASGASPAELKYTLLREYPNLFFCDPDFYPVPQADEADLARERFPQLQADPGEFSVILAHNGLSRLTTFTDAQKLLIYREHKKLAGIWFTLSGDKYQFELRTRDATQGYLIRGLIDGRGAITEQERQSGFYITTCPKCLAAWTHISTPQGSVAVEDLKVGDLVWTIDATGARLAAPILKVIRVPVSANHPMVHVGLADGRELWASLGHPLIDGQALGNLNLGDWLDGARITQFDLVPYDQPATYDLLPSGGTGFYWANDILLGSTLANR